MLNDVHIFRLLISNKATNICFFIIFIFLLLSAYVQDKPSENRFHGLIGSATQISG